MAERRGSSDSSMASPLFSEGVHHAEVSTPMWGKDVPDPLGYISLSASDGVPMLNRGSGDDVNDWNDQFPDEA